MIHDHQTSIMENGTEEEESSLSHKKWEVINFMREIDGELGRNQFYPNQLASQRNPNTGREERKQQ